MLIPFGGILAILWFSSGQVEALYAPLREYAGKTFFDGWDFAGSIDNTTWGNVTFISEFAASSDQLAYVNSAGNVILRVDNTTDVSVNEDNLAFRNSVKITTRDTYPLGSLIVIDILHIPVGCSVWPSFWTLGGSDAEWPMYGEIDIIEGVNLMSFNQMALHHNNTACVQPVDVAQLGRTSNTGCADQAGTIGCRVAETKPGSFGGEFNEIGGGAFALQYDVAGAFIWFWPRNDIPKSITDATSSSEIDLIDWGLPSASYPSAGCDLQALFKDQKLILDITLCGSWAGAVWSGSGCEGQCVQDWVLGPGTKKYDEAFFEISYVRTYQATNDTSSTSGAASSTVTSSVISTTNGTLEAPSQTGSDNEGDSGVALRPLVLAGWWVWAAGWCASLAVQIML